MPKGMKKIIYHEKLKNQIFIKLNSTHREEQFGVYKVGLSSVFHNMGLKGLNSNLK